MHFVGKVAKDGTLDPEVRKLIARFISLHADRLVKVDVVRFVKRRSDNQNRFFHGPFLAACLDMYHQAGNIEHDEAQVKEDLKELFGIREEHPTKRPDGTEAWGLKSTADYSTVEMEDFMEKIRAWASQYGFQLPFPNEAQ